MNSSTYTCKSGAVFQWRRDEAPGVAGVLSGYFTTQPSDADVAEVQAFLHTQVPVNGTVEFCKVFSDSTPADVKQRAATITDQLLGRASRN